MQTKFVISVVLPAYNEEKLIGRCLTSLKNQTLQEPYEIIVINNNSTDKTETIAKSLGVRVVTEAMQSVVAARQRGLQEASAPLIAGADADCVYPDGWLAAIYKRYTDPSVVAVGGPAIAEKNPYWAYLIYKIGFDAIYALYRLTGYVWYLGGFNLSFRRDAFLKLGGYRTYLDFGGDEWDVLGRLRKIGKVVFEPKAFMYISTRRYRVGFIRWFFVHNLYYYFFNYLFAQTFKKPLVRAKPVREN